MKILINEKLRVLGKSTRWLANISNIPYTTLSRLAKGTDIKSLSMEDLDKICTALGCSLEDILVADINSEVGAKASLENSLLALSSRLQVLNNLNTLKSQANPEDRIHYDNIAMDMEQLFNKKYVNSLSFDFDKSSNKNIDDLLRTYEDIVTLDIHDTKGLTHDDSVEKFKFIHNRVLEEDFPVDEVDNLELLFDLVDSVDEIIRKSEQHSSSFNEVG